MSEMDMLHMTELRRTSRPSPVLRAEMNLQSCIFSNSLLQSIG